jgi:glycosyltransferase involved in cell wall biosynthesis
MNELRHGVTVLVGCHPERLSNGLAMEALGSISRQTLQPDTIILVNDLERAGAGRTRQKLLRMVETEWLAWLDSDDMWLPKHLEKLYNHAQETGAVFVNSWFNAPHDPLGHFGKPLDPCNPHHTTITFMVKTELAQEVGFRESLKDSPFSEEDWHHISGIAALCCERGLKMEHLPEKTWWWRQQGQNTSGLFRPGEGDIPAGAE